MKKPIRPIHIEGNIAYVPLTRGFTATVDVCDVPLIENMNWYALGRAPQGAAHNEHKNGKTRTILMHRLIMDAGDSPLCVDHIDMNPLNNCRRNLRMATKAENMRNRGPVASNPLGLKGVSWSSDRKKFESSIMVNYRKISLGRFNTAEEAHTAYCRASAEFHGEFGRTSR